MYSLLGTKVYPFLIARNDKDAELYVHCTNTIPLTLLKKITFLTFHSINQFQKNFNI